MAKVAREKETAPWPLEIIRSKRRQKTVQAKVQNGRLIIRAPAAMTDAQLAPIIDKLQKRRARRAAPASDEMLEKMAHQLNRLYFNGRLHWQSIRFVTNQNSRYGSCTPSHGTIRLSHRLAPMPPWVLKYVLLHELAHLQQPNHGPRFWAIVNQYPLTERARGYLMGVGMEEEENNEL
jgi:predicted metal-dependent hydrolase